MATRLIDDVNALLQRFGLPNAHELIGRRFLYESQLRSEDSNHLDEFYPAFLISTITGVNAFIQEPSGKGCPEQLDVSLSVAAPQFGLYDILRLHLFFRGEVPTFTLEYSVRHVGYGPDESDIEGEDGTFKLLD